MNTKLMASVSVLALVLAGCASNEPKPFVETPETIYIVCKNALGRFFNVDIHKCLVFQKLNTQEETLLAVINYLNKK